MQSTDQVLKDLSGFLVNSVLQDSNSQSYDNANLLQQVFVKYLNGLDSSDHLFCHTVVTPLNEQIISFQLKNSEITLPLEEFNSLSEAKIKELVYQILAESMYS